MSLQEDKKNANEDGSSKSVFNSKFNPTVESYAEEKEHNATIDLELFFDAGVWNIPLSDAIRIQLVSREPNNLQNKMAIQFYRKARCKSLGRFETF